MYSGTGSKGTLPGGPECVDNFETPVAGSLVSDAALLRVRAASVLEIDADLYGQSGCCWMTLGEALGMCNKCLIEDALSNVAELLRPAGVHGRRRHVADAGVPMGVVVPGEEPLTERTGVLDRVKARRKVGLVLQGLELRFRVRIVVADMWPAVVLGDAQIGQEQGHRFGPRSACKVSCPHTIASLSPMSS